MIKGAFKKNKKVLKAFIQLVFHKKKKKFQAQMPSCYLQTQEKSLTRHLHGWTDKDDYCQEKHSWATRKKDTTRWHNLEK